ncbi:hypothetical protein [Holdemania massiliensis]|uniref:hypothetical protein n=1 Tax=Holdemania massiliensis TaxID=1468449 RepID=UPI0035210E98
MRHVDLTQLPRDKRNYIAWNQAAGFQIPFIYDHLRGEMTILQANKGKHGEAILEIEFENRIIHSVPASSVKNCILGRILQTRSFDFVTVIGQQFQDERRHYQIVDQRRGVLKSNPQATQREVEILCFLCGAKTWMAEDRVLPPKNCACRRCRYSPLSGRPSIVETDPWMIPFFPGGIAQARQYTHGQNQKLRFRCPYCGKIREKAIAISTLSRTHSIGCACCWSVGRSFPHRLIKCVLDSLKVPYIQEASRKDLPWAQTYSYDFYLPELNAIIEAHGKQHYEEGTGYFKNALKKNRTADLHKKQLACDHGIPPFRYIEINCRKSETEFIKNNLLRSPLPALLNSDLTELDWLQITRTAWKSEKLSILAYSLDNPDKSVRNIAKHFGVGRDLVKEVQVSAGIYDAAKERKLGVKRQQAFYADRTKLRDEKICQLKRSHPQFSTQDIAERVGMERHAVYRILLRKGLYDDQTEKANKHLKISASRKRIKDSEIRQICQLKLDNPEISAREAGRMTGHGHSTIMRIWSDNQLIKYR